MGRCEHKEIKLTGSHEPVANIPTQEFDARLERMQTPEIRAAVERLVHATPEELGRAAVGKAEREGNGRAERAQGRNDG